jgi:hypothetical protein
MQPIASQMSAWPFGRFRNDGVAATASFSRQGNRTRCRRSPRIPKSLLGFWPTACVALRYSRAGRRLGGKAATGKTSRGTGPPSRKYSGSPQYCPAPFYGPHAVWPVYFHSTSANNVQPASACLPEGLIGRAMPTALPSRLCGSDHPANCGRQPRRAQGRSNWPPLCRSQQKTRLPAEREPILTSHPDQFGACATAWA